MTRHVCGLLVGFASFFAVTCGDGTDAGLAVHAMPQLAATASVTGSGGDARLELGDGISVERIRLVVRKIELEGLDAEAHGNGSTCDRDGEDGMPDGEDDADPDGKSCEREYAFGPFAIDLQASDFASATGAVWQFTAPVPEGTYEETEIVVNTLPPGGTWDSAALRDLAALGASFVVDGTVDGTSFRLAAPLALKVEREGRFLVPASGAAVTLTVDPSTWFHGAGGRLDPTSATDRDAILANVRASFRVVSDDDHDGCDDDGDDEPACSGQSR